VLLADDHAIVRGGVKEILVRRLGSMECGEPRMLNRFLPKSGRIPGIC